MKKIILIKLLLFSVIFKGQTLNPNFGNGGIVTESYSDYYSNNKILQAALTSTGKLLVLGNSNNSYSASGFLSRMNPSGVIDYSFSPIGYKSCGTSYPSTLALQSDDKIIVSGRTYFSVLGTSSPLVSRYNADGSLDPSFSCLASTYSSMVSTVNDFYSQSIAIQSDGKIVVGGYIRKGTTTTADIDMVLFRLNTDGSLDTSFGSVGFIVVNNPTNDFLFSLAIQPDGKIIAAGSISSNFCCWRFTTNGSYDTSFGTNGFVTKDFGGIDVARRVALVQSTGEIIVSGVSNNKIAFIKYSSSGTELYNQNTSYPLTLTTLVISSNSGTNYNTAATNLKYIEATHKILISGTSNNTISVFQFDDSLNGTSDGQYSYSSPDTGANNLSSFLVALPNGNIVTGGSSLNTYGYSMNIGQLNSSGTVLNNNKLNFIKKNDSYSTSVEMNDGNLLVINNSADVIKYNSSGTKDLTYGINGVTSLSDISNMAKRLPNGEIIYLQLSGQDLFKLNPDGTIYTVFNGTTYVPFNFNLPSVLTTIPSVTFNTNIVIIDCFDFSPDGKIYVGFEDADSSGPSTIYHLIRLNSDFSLDTSFGTGGLTSFTFPSSISYGMPRDVAAQNNGKVVVSGIVNYSTAAAPQLGICRFNNDGSLDTSFNATGYIQLPQTANYWPSKIINLSDNSFILNETKYVTNHYEYDLIKFNSNGFLDTTFGTNGVLNDDLSQISSNEFIVLSNQKIIKAGNSNTPNYTYQSKMVGYTSNGTLDTSFGTNGYVTTNINSFSNISNLTQLQNGSLLATGTSFTNGNYIATMAEYNLGSMGIEAFTDIKNSFIYPNPATSKISFDNSNEKFESVTVYNSLGQEILSSNLNATNDNLDVSNLSSGIYILNFKSPDNFKSVKLIKH